MHVNLCTVEEEMRQTCTKCTLTENISQHKKFLFRFRGTRWWVGSVWMCGCVQYNASPWIKNSNYDCQCSEEKYVTATVCEPTVTILNNNVARAPMAKAVELPFFFPRQKRCTERDGNNGNFLLAAGVQLTVSKNVFSIDFVSEQYCKPTHDVVIFML